MALYQTELRDFCYMEAIHLIITGGTIDSYYEGSLDTVKPSEKSIIPSYDYQEVAKNISEGRFYSLFKREG